MSSRMRRRIVHVSATAALVGVALSIWVGGRLTAPSPSVVGAPPTEIAAESIELRDASGRRVRGWNAPCPEGRAAVVLAHGIRGNRTAMVPRAKLLAKHGLSSVLIDLHGHGESEGGQITLGLQEAQSIKAAVAFAKDAYPGQPVAVLGVSLGGAAAALALPLSIEALVLESVFPDVESAIRNRVRARLGALAALPAWLLLAQVEPRLGVAPEVLSPVRALAKLGGPALIMGGDADLHTPAEETTRLHRAAPPGSELWIVPGAGHVDLYQAAGAQYERRLIAFLTDSLLSD